MDSTQIQATKRKRVNFMVDQKLIATLEQYVPTGERSDFINKVMEKALTQLSRENASKSLKAFKKSHPIKLSTHDILNFIHENRRY